MEHPAGPGGTHRNSARPGGRTWVLAIREEDGVREILLVAPVLSSELSLGNVAPLSQVFGSMPGKTARSEHLHPQRRQLA